MGVGWRAGGTSSGESTIYIKDMMNSAFIRMNVVFKMMNFVLKMADSAFKISSGAKGLHTLRHFRSTLVRKGRGSWRWRPCAWLWV